MTLDLALIRVLTVLSTFLSTEPVETFWDLEQPMTQQDRAMLAKAVSILRRCLRGMAEEDAARIAQAVLNHERGVHEPAP